MYQDSSRLLELAPRCSLGHARRAEIYSATFNYEEALRAYQEVGWLDGWLEGGLVGGVIVGCVVWVFGWVGRWLVGWLVGWFNGCLVSLMGVGYV